ncbi:MAG: hypothetical protein QOH06_5525 [Acidobacteriota bacterium]|jgi:hypothetical protein|nr:hypothetical protein [Acidobacteriota bacterium]
MRRYLVIAFALTLAMAGTASAWQENAGANPPAGGAAQNPPVTPVTVTPVTQVTLATAALPCSTDLSAVKVTKVWSVPPLDEETGTPTAAASTPSKVEKGEHGLPLVKLRDTIAVKIENLPTLLNLERCLDQLGTQRDIILYLDRRPLPDVVAAPPNDPGKRVLMFPLERTEKSRDVWTYLLGRPGLDDREVEVSVGINDQFALGSDADVDLRVIPRGWFTVWVLIFAVFLIGFFLLARRSDLLRDPVKAPYGARPPYSLSRTQAAWWFFLVLASYLLIGMVTGDFFTTITGSTLVLLGISAGTAAGSAFIDASKSSRISNAQDSARATVLWSEIQTLGQETAALQTTVQTNVDPAKAQELADKEAMRMEKLSMYRKLTNQSESFLLDLLSDSGGVNFHRFQALAWTVVLGIIFGCHVYRDLAMPQLSETLLGLMGISSATYLSLKIPENPSPDPAPPNAPAPPDSNPST